jgi:hypothetical protein
MFDGVVGYVSCAFVNQLSHQIVQISIKSYFGTSCPTVAVPTQTSEVDLVQSKKLNNPQ